MQMETKDSPAAGPDEDLYSDGADGSDGGDKTDATDKPGDDSADQQDDATEAVLPKSILAGKEFNVGDEVVLKVTGIHDDQISVKYSTGKDDGSKDPDADGDTDKAAMPAGMETDGGDYD
jgi:hypothetical protein